MFESSTKKKSTKKSVEALVAVWLVSLLFEGSLVKLLQTETAHKALRMKLPEHGGDTAALDGLVAARAEAAPEAVVMGLAVREALVLIELAAPEWLPTLLAHKALRMPLLIQGGDVIVFDGQVASSTLGGKLTKVTIFAECPIVPLVKAVIPELGAARLALEALRVPGGVQRADALVQDGAPAPRAPGTEEGVVALLTKWFAVSLEKVLSPKLHVTLAAGEAAGMPGAAQRGDHLAHDGLLACGADPLLLGLDPLLGHVLLQVTQHRVQAGQAADNWLINISPIHFEVVQGSHQVVQFCCGGGGSPRSGVVRHFPREG